MCHRCVFFLSHLFIVHHPISLRPCIALSLCRAVRVCSEKCKARGFTVIVDGRRSQWNVVKTVVLMLQVRRDEHVHTYMHCTAYTQ